MEIDRKTRKPIYQTDKLLKAKSEALKLLKYFTTEYVERLKSSHNNLYEKVFNEYVRFENNKELEQHNQIS